MAEPLIDPHVLRGYLRPLGVDELLIRDDDLERFVDDLLSFATNYTREGVDVLSIAGRAQASHHVATALPTAVTRAWESAALPDADEQTKSAFAFVVAHLLHPRGYDSDLDPLRLNGYTLAAIWRGMNSAARQIDRAPLAALQVALLALVEGTLDRDGAEPISAAQGRVPGLFRQLHPSQVEPVWIAEQALGDFDAAAVGRFLLGLDAYWAHRIDQPADVEVATDPDALMEATVNDIVEVISDVYSTSLGSVVDRGLLDRLAQEAGARLLEKLAA